MERAARLGVDAVKISMFFQPGGDTSAAKDFVHRGGRNSAANSTCPSSPNPWALYDQPARKKRSGPGRGKALRTPGRRRPEAPVSPNRPRTPPPRTGRRPAVRSTASAPVPWAIPLRRRRLPPVPPTTDRRLPSRRLRLPGRAGGVAGGGHRRRQPGSGPVAGSVELNSIAVTEGVDWRSRQ